MLKLDPNPTFKWPVQFKSPEGSHTISLVFKHMPVEAHDTWWQDAVRRSLAFAEALKAHADKVAQLAAGEVEPPAPKAEKSGLDEVMDVVAGWEEVDGEFSREAMGKLLANYHDLTVRKICEAWSAGLTQRKLEN